MNSTQNITNQNHQPLRVIFAGTPEFAAEILQSLIDMQNSTQKIDIVAVYTQPDRKQGRGQKIVQSPVKLLAKAHMFHVEQPESFSKTHIDGAHARQRLQDFNADVMVVAAYGLLLPKQVLNAPRLGCLNVHASILPRWRGAAPIQHAILANDAQTGITIMQMDAGLDTGDMLHKTYCDILSTDTTQTLHDKLAKQGAEAIVTVLDDIKYYQQHAIAQDDALATYAHKISSSDGLIDWQEDAHAIYRKICALNAYTFLDGVRIKIISATKIKPHQITHEPAGTVVSVGKNAILVACGKNTDGQAQLINITAMQWAGKSIWSARDIVNSNKLNDGDVLGI